MNAFFRFPHTPHLAWLGAGAPREDKVLEADVAARLLDGPVCVEEKADGANLGFSVGPDLRLRAQNRGAWIDETAASPQFGPLRAWLAPRRAALVEALWPDLVLFGEWCAATHSVRYERLPDWFLGFDVYDREREAFFDASRRDALLGGLGLHPVPTLGEGRFDLDGLCALLGRSRLGEEPMEGLVVRSSADGVTTERAKLVRPGFLQGIGEHWSRGPLRRNALGSR